MNAETLNLATSGGATTAYVARPHTEVDAGIVLIQEWWGINNHICDIAGRYANKAIYAWPRIFIAGEWRLIPRKLRR